MFASTISMLTSSTTALAGSRIAPCSKMAPLGRTSSLMMAVETGDKLVEDNLGAASESGYTCDRPPFEPRNHRLADPFAACWPDPVLPVLCQSRPGGTRTGIKPARC